MPSRSLRASISLSSIRFATNSCNTRSSSSKPRRHFHRNLFFELASTGVPLNRALHHQFLDLADRPRRVQVLRADVDAVHDGMAAEQAVRVLEVVEALRGFLVARIGDEAV